MEEIELKGGRSNEEVVKVGDTVRRECGPHSEFVHKVLKLLEEKGFEYSPRFLGVDEQGREILTYMEGEVPRGEYEWTDDRLLHAVRILRNFHDATEGSDLAEDVVCHNDFAPWNFIVSQDGPVAVIDFDDATPGKREDDLSYFLWTFLGLGPEVSMEDVQPKIAMICREYGNQDGKRLVEALLEQQNRILEERKHLSQNAKTEEERKFSAERIDLIQKEIEWVESNREQIEEACMA